MMRNAVTVYSDKFIVTSAMKRGEYQARLMIAFREQEEKKAATTVELEVVEVVVTVEGVSGFSALLIAHRHLVLDVACNGTVSAHTFTSTHST